MKRAVIYCRVSTKEQTKNLSMSTQLSKCRDYCDRNGFDVARVFDDGGESAKTADRTAFKEMLEFCRVNKKQVDVVIVYNMSRFARNTLDHVTVRAVLRSYGIAFRSATEEIGDDAAGKMMENILATFAQFDNDVKSDRTKAGMRAALERGRWVWRPPLGYTTGRTKQGEPSLQRDPERAPIIASAFAAIANDGLSLREALRRASALGLTTLRGKPLTPQSFGGLMGNPVYAGTPDTSKSGISAFRADFEPIVSRELFERTQRALGRPKGRQQHMLANPAFPLRRFVECGKCSTPLTGSASTGRKAKYAYYHCRKCPSVRIATGELEAQFLALLDALKPRPEFVRLFHAVVTDVLCERRAEAATLVRRLEARVSDLRHRERQLEAAFLYEKRVDDTTYERQRDLIRADLALALMEADDARCEEIDAEGVLGFAEYVLSNASKLWTEATPEQKQKLQAVLFPAKLRFADGGFGTAVTCLAFYQLEGFFAGKEKMASPSGFEPESRP